jgi:RNA polymerase sigma-B factor
MSTSVCLPSNAHEGRSRREIEAELFARFAGGDLRARRELIERCLPLALSVASRYARSQEPMDDLVQVASLALINAVDRFDPARECSFASFAVPTIIGELKRHFRDHTWTVRPPRGLQELTLRVEATADRLLQALDRAPTVSELAVELEVDEEQILEALQARRGRSGVSLQTPMLEEDHAGTLEDMVGSEDAGLDRAEARVSVERLLRLLPPRDREIIRLRFSEDLTQQEIGVLMGISQMQISRILRNSLERLREHVAREPVAQEPMAAA